MVLHLPLPSSTSPFSSDPDVLERDALEHDTALLGAYSAGFTDHGLRPLRVQNRIPEKAANQTVRSFGKKSCTKYGCAAEGEGIDVAIVMLQAITLREDNKDRFWIASMTA